MKNYWLDQDPTQEEIRDEIRCWDFNTELGDTIRAKYESLYVNIKQVERTMDRKTVRILSLEEWQE